MDPSCWLTHLENRLKQDLWPTPEELKGLLGLCRHPLPEVRDKALLLLLSPPLTDEITYCRWLIPQVLGHGAKIRDLPEALLDTFCELYAFLDGVSPASSLRAPFERVLKRLPNSSRRRLLCKSFPLKPFVAHLSARLFNGCKRALPFSSRKKFRILRKVLIELNSHDPACDPTLADLQPIWASRGGCRKPERFRGIGRWRLIGRTLLLPVGDRSPRSTPGPAVAIHGAGGSGPAGSAGWLQRTTHIPWLSKGALCYLEKLFGQQAKELAAVRGLASQVSHNTGRVVLSWHNASLAAAGGWGFQHVRGQFPSATLWHTFRRRVASRLKAWDAADRQDEAIIQQLAGLWEQRLIHPRLAHLLWESRIRALFDDFRAPVYRATFRVCEKLLAPALIDQVVAGKTYSLHGAVSPHQRLEMGAVLRHRRRHRQNWRRGLLLLVAMAEEGQRLLKEDRLPQLVLPWIDKFFISSRRDEDLPFLTSLVNWIAGQEPKPLILLWEDTPHADAPSLQLALDILRRQGFPCRGIGVFDSLHSSRSEALQIICKEHQDILFFALRPCSDTHYPKSFFQLLAERDHEFFERYDSAWKDDLAFIYAGTQVMPLLSVSCETEPFPGWVTVDGRKQPFGRWFRQVLRAMALGENCEPGEPFSLHYSRWANLC